MKRRFLASPTRRPRKNDLRILFITNDLGSADTLPTPKNTLSLGRAHDA
jgi:hypothetical protein